MNARFTRHVGRREFLKRSGLVALVLNGFAAVPSAEGLPQGTEDPPTRTTC
jgi:hypothetical protein